MIEQNEFGGWDVSCPPLWQDGDVVCLRPALQPDVLPCIRLASYSAGVRQGHGAYSSPLVASGISRPTASASSVATRRSVSR